LLGFPPAMVAFCGDFNPKGSECTRGAGTAMVALCGDFNPKGSEVAPAFPVVAGLQRAWLRCVRSWFHVRIVALVDEES
jgi:hypothetical protein